MKRTASTALAVLSLAIVVAGCASSQSSEPPPHAATTPKAITPKAKVEEEVVMGHNGWTESMINRLVVTFREDEPNATKAEAECAVHWEAERYTPEEGARLSSAETQKLGEEEAHACK